MLETIEVKSEKPNRKEAKLYVDFGQTVLKRIGNMLGFAGFYYDTEYHWATTPEKIIEAWNWFNQKTQVNEGYWTDIEFETVWDFLDNNCSPFTSTFRDANTFRDALAVDILSLIIDLHALDSLKVDVSEKLSEIKKKMKGNINAYEKLSRKVEFSTNDTSTRKACLRVTNLRKDLAHLSSESKLARLAKHYGFDVELTVHRGDLVINGKRIDVKKPEDKYIIPKKRNVLTFISDEATVIENLSNHIEEGFRQNVDIVAIKVRHLDKREIKGFNSEWLEVDDLKTVLQNAFNYDKKGIVLLFKDSSEGYSGRIIRCWKKQREIN
jgi:hypothetical protein